MLKERIKKRVDMMYKQISPAPFGLLILVAMSSLALTYVFTVPDEHGNAHYAHVSFFDRSSEDAKETTRQAIPKPIRMIGSPRRASKRSIRLPAGRTANRVPPMMAASK